MDLQSPPRLSFFSKANCDIEAFAKICASQKVNKADYPLAADVIHNVVVFDGDAIRSASNNVGAFQDEIAHALQYGPGVIAINVSTTTLP
ncbi:hypothetical protein [Grimontia sedimenti]|uniref:hypothetical protein n=1 Tax=Grimontia sedimenti TaxID=2711294 RepID=UPI001F173064|nr:hypothetical protein [Grimontia sedimenti]